MKKLVNRHRRKQHIPERGHLLAGRFGVEGRSDRILHPRVGHQNPQRRQVRADGRQPGRRKVKTSGHLIPAEKHHGDERTFQKKGHNSFDCQRRSENIADEIGVIRPVRPELEFEDQSGGHADREIDPENAHPKLDRPFPERIAGTVVNGLHDGADETQPEGQRHEQPMVDGRHRKLGPRPIHHLRQLICSKNHNINDLYSTIVPSYTRSAPGRCRISPSRPGKRTAAGSRT